jgi:alpha-N-arabinofuranosidase
MRTASLAAGLLSVAAMIAACSSNQEADDDDTGTGGAGPAVCGNAILEAGETCDPGSGTPCSADCNDNATCTTDVMQGSPATCDVVCTNTVITACAPNDSCCPAGCDATTDPDCSASCGDGVVDPSQNETCDPIDTCPTTCDDGIACTFDQLTGNAASCSAACSHTAITACTPGDGCCPGGCTSAVDTDCTGGAGGTGGAATGGAATGGGGATTGGGGATTGGGGATTGGVATGGGGAATGGLGTGGATGGAGLGGAPLDCNESDIPDSSNSLGVAVNDATVVVSKEIFGLLMEDLGNDVRNGVFVGTGSSIPNTNGVRDDITAAFAEAGVGAIEWPGGCAANNYNWQNANPSNNMVTDTFLQFAQAVGAEAVLVGPGDASAADSNRAWIDYVKSTGYDLKYFKVGNEVWGCGGNLGHDYAASGYEGWFTANAAAIDGSVDWLIAATAGIWTVDPNSSGDWIDQMLGSIGGQMQGVEIHDYIYYPDDVDCINFTEEEYYDIVCRADECQMGPRIDDIRTILDRHGDQQIILDEWGDWLIDLGRDGWQQQNTVMDALSAGISLNLFMRNADRVRMAGLAQAVNVIHSLILTDSAWGGTNMVKTPTFYVFKMFKPHQLGRYAPVTVSSEQITGGGHTFSVVSSAATVNDAGEVSVSMTNVDLQNSRDVTITLDTDTANWNVISAEVVTGAEKNSYNDFGAAETVNIQPLDPSNYDFCGKKVRVTLPTKSVVMLRMAPAQ